MNSCAIWDVILRHLSYTTFTIACYLHLSMPQSLSLIYWGWKKKRKAGHLEEVSFFIILELYIWSFKNSVNPAVRTKKKVLLGLLQSLMSSWSLVTNLSSLHTSHSQEVKHGALWGNIYWPLAITANSRCARTKGGKKLSTSIQGDVCLCRG